MAKNGHFLCESLSHLVTHNLVKKSQTFLSLWLIAILSRYKKDGKTERSNWKITAHP